MKSKYALLSRSQVIIRLNALEQTLLHSRAGSERYRKAQTERQELFDVLRAKDDALIKKFWESQREQASLRS